MRLFYQSFGVSRGSRDGAYGQVLERILEGRRLREPRFPSTG